MILCGWKDWSCFIHDRWQLLSSLSLKRHAHGTLAKHLMHMAHFSGNTSGMSKSSSDWLNLTRFRGDASVYFRSAGKQRCRGAKPPHERRKPSCLQMWWRTYQGQLNAGFSKVCEIFKVRSIESLKYIREFHTSVCYCGDISMPRNVTLNETNCDWLFDMSVKRPHGWALANESGHLFQTFSHQSEGLATRD